VSEPAAVALIDEAEQIARMIYALRQRLWQTDVRAGRPAFGFNVNRSAASRAAR
jgi:hypothetical protein